MFLQLSFNFYIIVCGYKIENLENWNIDKLLLDLLSI